MNSTESNTAVTVHQVLERIQELQLNFLAIDFDATLIDIHTGGRWSGTPDDLVPHVRPIFLDLIASALSSIHPQPIHVAIVTFSRQPDMIRSLLEKTLGKEMASKIVIRGRDNSWKYGKQPYRGKQEYMASAAEEFLQLPNGDPVPGLEITRNTTLLIDDDKNNIRIALEDGVRAVWFSPKQPQNLYKDLIALV